MKTEIIKINNPATAQDELCRAAQILRRGGLVVFPTETVYGLGGDATDPDAARKIYEAKGRPSNNPLIIHIAHPEDAEQYAVTNEYYYRLARAFMPGPLTVILPKKDTIPVEVTGGLDTVAVRCPSHPVAHALIKATERPIAAPSANISGRPSPTSADYCISDLEGKVDMIIDGGECDIGLESTIVMLRGSTAVLLRPGAVTYDALCCVCETVELSAAAEGTLAENERPLAPGMMYRHYAPNAPFVLLDGAREAFIPYIQSRRMSGEQCAVICSAEEAKALDEKNTVIYGDPEDLTTQAHRLFSALREADVLGCDVIYARKPATDGLGLALYNRMIRAASHTVIKI
ncbi:MAG: threonylcarbamoyl-AMP synthase [Clostridia bacterium]|nr:threonylcarbamoyl-AMP synthase [Clostridia bacterium]